MKSARCGMPALGRGFASCAVLAAAGLAHAQMQKCDTAALVAAIPTVTAGCCGPNDGCSADGVPTHCSERCAEVFLPFMDTYNHGSCMPLLQMFGAQMHLGDLEADCREDDGTDGGADASEADCGPESGMLIALSCAQVTAADKAFCEGDCAARLAPFQEECAAMMPAYLSTMLAAPISMLAQCDDGSERECDMVALMTACQEAPLGDGATIDELCANSCTQGMIPCADNPLLTMSLGPEAASTIGQIEAMCAEAPEGATGGADGICDLNSLMSCSTNGSIEACGQDVQCICRDECTGEMMDCVVRRTPPLLSLLKPPTARQCAQDSPIMADAHDDIVGMTTACSALVTDGEFRNGLSPRCRLTQTVAANSTRRCQGSRRRAVQLALGQRSVRRRHAGSGHGGRYPRRRDLCTPLRPGDDRLYVSHTHPSLFRTAVSPVANGTGMGLLVECICQRAR